MDGAITSAGGERLHQARMALPIILTREVQAFPGGETERMSWGAKTRCKTGDAKLTVGGDLRATYVVGRCTLNSVDP